MVILCLFFLVSKCKASKAQTYTYSRAFGLYHFIYPSWITYLWMDKNRWKQYLFNSFHCYWQLIIVSNITINLVDFVNTICDTNMNGINRKTFWSLTYKTSFVSNDLCCKATSFYTINSFVDVTNSKSYKSY